VFKRKAVQHRSFFGPSWPQLNRFNRCQISVSQYVLKPVSYYVHVGGRVWYIDRFLLPSGTKQACTTVNGISQMETCFLFVG